MAFSKNLWPRALPGSDLECATPAVKWGLGFYCLIQGATLFNKGYGKQGRYWDLGFTTSKTVMYYNTWFLYVYDLYGLS